MSKRANTEVIEPTASKDVLIAVYVSKELLEKIDEARWTQRVEGRAATVRKLVEIGLEHMSV